MNKNTEKSNTSEPFSKNYKIKLFKKFKKFLKKKKEKTHRGKKKLLRN